MMNMMGMDGRAHINKAKRREEWKRERERASERGKEMTRRKRRRLECKTNKGRKARGKEKLWQPCKTCSSSRKLRLPCTPLVPVFSAIGRWLSL